MESLYRAFFLRLVRRVTWKYGLGKDDAREIVQDAFLLAIARLEPDRNPRAWIYSVVDRLAANWKRKIGRRALLLARWHPPSRTNERLRSETEEYADGTD